MVHLVAVRGQSLCCVELSVAVWALEVLGLLVKDQGGLVAKYPITIPAENLVFILVFLFLLCHFSECVILLSGGSAGDSVAISGITARPAR